MGENIISDPKIRVDLWTVYTVWMRVYTVHFSWRLTKSGY